MSVSVQKNEVPPLRFPHMVCDIKLHPKLDKIELTKHMNKSFFALILGLPGTGKTSLLTAFLQTPQYFNRVWHKIFLFMPEGSRKSIKDSVFDSLPDNQKFTELTCENLEICRKMAEANWKKKPKEKTLIIMDDVQDAFKEKEVAKLFLKIVTNRRHMGLCLFALAQTYKKLARPVRATASDIFAFDLSPEDFENVFTEHVQHKKEYWQMVLDLYVTRVQEENVKKIREEPYEHVFMYLNTADKVIFINFDEVTIHRKEEDEKAIQNTTTGNELDTTKNKKRKIEAIESKEEKKEKN